MTTLAWATDLHLDWADASQRRAFFDAVLAACPDAVALSGDIAEGVHTAVYLEHMAQEFRRPIYFVLGNHDFYGGSIATKRQQITSLAANSPQLHYLTTGGFHPLSSRTVILGHDGWGDARLGDYLHTKVSLPDFVVIEELAEVRHDRLALLSRLNRLGEEAARTLVASLKEALGRYHQVVLVTHVPPFREAAWYDGRYSDDNWLPFFSCGAMGDMLRRTMEDHPDRHLLVLCGHTHGGGESQILPNLRVVTGAAEGTGPILQRCFCFE